MSNRKPNTSRLERALDSVRVARLGTGESAVVDGARLVANAVALRALGLAGLASRTGSLGGGGSRVRGFGGPSSDRGGRSLGGRRSRRGRGNLGGRRGGRLARDVLNIESKLGRRAREARQNTHESGARDLVGAGRNTVLVKGRVDVNKPVLSGVELSSRSSRGGSVSTSSNLDLDACRVLMPRN